MFDPPARMNMFIWVVPKIGVPQNGWFIMENPIKWVVWGYPYFWKHPFLGDRFIPEKKKAASLATMIFLGDLGIAR